MADPCPRAVGEEVAADPCPLPAGRGGGGRSATCVSPGEVVEVDPTPHLLRTPSEPSPVGGVAVTGGGRGARG